MNNSGYFKEIKMPMAGVELTRIYPNDELYRCWKQAVNSLYSPDRSSSESYNSVEQEYGIRTVSKQCDLHGYTQWVDIQILKPELESFFIMKWKSSGKLVESPENIFAYTPTNPVVGQVFLTNNEIVVYDGDDFIRLV